MIFLVELPLKIRVLEGGWKEWEEAYADHPQLYEKIHPTEQQLVLKEPDVVKKIRSFRL